MQFWTLASSTIHTGPICNFELWLPPPFILALNMQFWTLASSIIHTDPICNFELWLPPLFILTQYTTLNPSFLCHSDWLNMHIWTGFLHHSYWPKMQMNSCFLHHSYWPNMQLWTLASSTTVFAPVSTPAPIKCPLTIFSKKSVISTTPPPLQKEEKIFTLT